MVAEQAGFVWGVVPAIPAADVRQQEADGEEQA
jgi:hypothetical protein